MISKSFHLPGCAAALFLFSSLAAVGADPSASKAPSKEPSNGKKTGIWCKVDKTNRSFCDGVKAVATSGGGVLLVGFDKQASLMIEIPKLKVGAASLKDALKPHLDFSRHIYSSQSSDHFAANAGTAESRLQVTIDRIDKSDQVIEGTFSATASSSGDGQVELTEGKFVLPLTEEKPGKP